MQKKWLNVLVLLIAVAMLPSTAPASTEVFFENFDGVVSGNLSGVTATTGVQGFAGLGPAGNQFGGNFLHNTTTGNPAAATVLTLTGLPAHSSIDINFLFGAIDSWDSNIVGAFGPDFFNVTVDGVLVFQPTFSVGGQFSYPNGLLSNGTQLGFNSAWNDRAYDMGQAPELQNIVHTASSLTINFFASGSGWQGGDDESWAIDNLKVMVNPVTTPLPGSVILLGSGLLGLVGLMRFRKS